MPNWGKTLQKRCSDQLDPGEQVTAGCFVQPAGAVARTMGLGAGQTIGTIAGGVLGEAGAKRRQEENDDASEGGIAATFPTDKAVLGLTNQRLVVFSHGTMNGKPKDLIASYPIDQLGGVELDKGKLSSKMLLRFTDGSAVDFDVPKAGSPDEFVGAVNALD